jgi:hypothetical protein
LQYPLARGLVQTAILEEADRLGYGVLAEVAGQHAGIGQIAGGALAQVVRRIAAEDLEKNGDGVFGSEKPQPVNGGGAGTAGGVVRVEGERLEDLFRLDAAVA